MAPSKRNVSPLFYGAALNAGLSNQDKAVRPSVCLSNACIVTKWNKELPRQVPRYGRKCKFN